MRPVRVTAAVAALLVASAAHADGPPPLPPPGAAQPAAPAAVAPAAGAPKKKAVAPAAEPAPEAPPPPATPKSTTTDTRKGITPFVAKLLRANAAFLARDFAGAVAGYREAIQEDAQNPVGHYMLGEAQLAAGNQGEAEASWGNGIRVSGSNEAVNAKLLFVMADLRERQGKYADAKRAWDEYASFVAAHPQVKGYTEVATERGKTDESRDELVRKYAAVKERIATREKELASPPPDDGPQGPTKPGAKPAAPPAPAAPSTPAAKPPAKKKDMPF